jgi:hypothetical protein
MTRVLRIASWPLWITSIRNRPFTPGPTASTGQSDVIRAMKSMYWGKTRGGFDQCTVGGLARFVTGGPS